MSDRDVVNSLRQRIATMSINGEGLVTLTVAEFQTLLREADRGERMSITNEREARDYFKLGVTEPLVKRSGTDGTLTVEWPNDVRPERVLLSADLLEQVISDLDVLSKVKHLVKDAL